MRYFTLLLCLGALVSCYSEPEFPVEPVINFKGVSFVDAPETPNTDGQFPADTLKITVSYQDGDGDLGMLTSDVEPFITLFDNRYIRIDDPNPPFPLPPMNCTNYTRGYFKANVFYPNSDSTDIIYIEPNPLYYNFFLDLYTIENGVETFFDFVELGYPMCGNSPNGRFALPISGKPRPISGSITYNFTSNLLLSYFYGEELKVKVRIADRAGNMSNIAESQVFTLQEIMK